MSGWGGLFVFFVASVLAVGGLIVLARLLRVEARHDSPLKRRGYECGEEPDGPAWIRFHPRYYVVALFFVLFDVEAAFFFPWAVSERALGWAGLASVVLFTAVLLIGWAYAIRKGALRWQ